MFRRYDLAELGGGKRTAARRLAYNPTVKNPRATRPSLRWTKYRQFNLNRDVEQAPKKATVYVPAETAAYIELPTNRYSRIRIRPPLS